MENRIFDVKPVLLTITMAVIFALTGCGGGNSGSGGDTTLSGTAASGAPILKNTPVYVKDANGKTAAGKINDDAGNYTVDASGLTPPFALCIDTSAAATPCSVGTDDKVLMAVTDKVGTANITPLTKLAAAAAAGIADPTDLFKNPGTTLKGLSAGQITQGQQAITAVMGDYLKAAGIDPASFNPLTTPFFANSKGVDSVLDKVKPSLAANGAVSIAFPGTSQGPVAIPDIRTPFASYSSSVKNGMRAAWPAIANSITPPTGIPAIIPGSVTIPAGFAFPPNAVLPSNVRIASGVILPAGITIPAGVNLPPNLIIPDGAILDSKLVLPAGVVIPSGVTMPPGMLIPSTATIPSSWQTAPPAGVTIPSGVTYTTPPVSTTPTPTITSFTPTSGAVGTTVTITGTNFGAGPAGGPKYDVKFNGVQGDVQGVGADITVKVPVGATTGTITVTTAGGTATSPGGFTVSTTGGGTPVGGGTTLTLSAPFTSISNLAYDTALSDRATTAPNYFRSWKNTSGETLTITYSNGPPLITEPQLIVSAATATASGAATGVFSIGPCLIGNTTNVANRALCSNLGITLDKTGGSITFAATPVANAFPNTPTYGQTGTVSGTFSFPPF
jgi:hypothetical protein